MKKQIKLMLGDNMESLKKLPDNSVDSIVSDPPYGLSFMSKKWDYDVPSIELWKEVYRVLKPGGHLLSFGGTRTYHRMVVNIEDAGFEIRDQIMWIYGSGFPKSHNISKAIDATKLCGGSSSRKLKEVEQTYGVGDYQLTGKNNGILGETKTFNRKKLDNQTEEAIKYEGWGTALKPANEPICVARKPLSESTIAANVLKWGTGGINVDGCRIGTEGATKRSHQAEYEKTEDGKEDRSVDWMRKGHSVVELQEGRFPANIIFDESAAEMLDEQSGVSKSNTKPRIVDNKEANILKEHKWDHKEYVGDYSDSGGASRFFYVAKVSASERNMGLDGFEEKEFEGRDELANGKQDEPFKKRPGLMKNTHPTVKPIQLMAYLCKLVTPAGGIVLDPFMGSGSTGIAAQLEGFRFIGMDMEEEYFNIASARIEAYEKYRPFINKKKKK